MEMIAESNLNYESEFRNLNLLLKEKKMEHFQNLKEESQRWNFAHEAKKCEILKYKENLNVLHLKIQNIQEDYTVALSGITTMDQELQNRKREVEEKQMKLKIQLEKKELLQEKLSAIKIRIKEEEKNLQLLENKDQVKIKQASNCVNLFKKYLGIRFTKTSKGSLIIIFIQVVRSNPEKEFMIELSIEKDEYRVLKSMPSIDNLESIEKNFNSTSNFCAFLIYVRGVFEKMESNILQ